MTVKFGYRVEVEVNCGYLNRKRETSDSQLWLSDMGEVNCDDVRDGLESIVIITESNSISRNVRLLECAVKSGYV